MSSTGLALAFVLLWATTFTAVRGVVPEWPALWALAIRFAVVVPILVGIAWWRRAPAPRRGDLGRLAAMGLCGIGLYLGAAWSATAFIPSGLVALISASTPLLVALGERALRGRRLPRLGWAGLGLGWAGVAILGWGRGADAAAGPEALLGVLLALLGALGHAVGLIAYAPARSRVDPWAANATQSVVAALALFAAALVFEPALPGPPSATVMGAMLYATFVVGIGAYWLLFVLLDRMPAARVASLQLLAPPMAAIFGWALFGEVLAPTDLVGGALSLAGLALLFRSR